MIRRITWLGAIFGVLIVLSVFVIPSLHVAHAAPDTIINSPLDTSGVWTNPTNAYSSNDSYATTSAKKNQEQIYHGYGFSLSGCSIVKVEVGVEAYGDSNDYLQIQVSWDGGTNWTSIVEHPPGTEESLVYLDLTDGRTWAPDELSDTYFRVKLTKQFEAPGSEMYIDWVPVQVTYCYPPEVTSVTLTETSMTPQMEYSVTVTVDDADGLADLDTVVLVIYYDSTGSDYDGSDETAHIQNCAIITWTEGGTFEIDAAGSITWSLGSCTSPGSLPGDFTFVFTPGKVATQTSDSAKWQLWAEATDDLSQSGTNYDTTPPTMNWYGEIDVPDATVDWGFVAPGLDFGEDTASEEAVGVTITYISNGAYDKKVKTTSSWSGSSYTATLDAGGTCGSANEFALEADDTGTLSSAVLVDTSGVIIDNTGGQTTEDGDAVTTHTLWLKLASSFNSDTYSGTITYIIAEHV